MKKLLAGISLAALLSGPASATMSTITTTQGSGGPVVGLTDDGSGHYVSLHALCGSSTLATLYATIAECAIVNSSGELLVSIPDTVTVANPALGLDGVSATPASAAYVGANSNGILRGIVQTGASTVVEPSSATTTQIVGLISGNRILVTSYEGTAPSGMWQLVYGTGTNCATGTTKASDSYTATGPQQGAGVGLGPVIVVPTGNALCVVTDSPVQYSFRVAYSQSP